jgi:hypothetical protein
LRFYLPGKPCLARVPVREALRSGRFPLLIMCIELHLEPGSRAPRITLNQANSMSSSHSRHWLTSCNPPMCLLCEARPGCPLNTLLGYTSVMPITVPKKKRSLLPVLTVLFLLSYGLMTMLIVEQGSVIQSQGNLIKLLLPDSRELWGIKGKAVVDQHAARAQAQSRAQAPSTLGQVPTAKTPSTQIPSTQIPSTQAPTQAPSTQAAPQHHSQGRAGRVAKPETQLPPVPASDLTDRRRALTTI